MNNTHAHKPGYKHTPLGWIPQEWSVIELGQLFEFKNGINASKERYGNGMKFANVMEVINNDNLNSNMLPGSIEVDEEQIDNYIVRRGDVLFNRTSETVEEIGLSSVYLDDEPAVFGGFVIRGRPISERLSDDYMRYCFRGQAVRRQITKGGQGAIRTNIGQTDLALVKIPVPEPAEQRSISDLLKCWDEAIQKTQQLIEQLKQRNKGLMQQLLTGKKRLKGFSGKWEEHELGDFIRESRLASSGTNIEKRITVRLNLRGVEKREVRGGESEDATLYYKRKAGQFIYGKQNLHKGAMGIVPENLDEYESSQDIPCFDFSGDIDPNFFLLFMGMENIYQGLEKISTGTGSKRIHPEELYKVRHIFPDLTEQKAIAQVLAAATSELNLQEQQLTTLQEQKKGLMQKLLSGEVRVK